MPCYDGQSHAEGQEAIRLLCHVCRYLERAGDPMPPAVEAWWKLHQIDDQRYNDHPEEAGK